MSIIELSRTLVNDAQNVSSKILCWLQNCNYTAKMENSATADVSIILKATNMHMQTEETTILEDNIQEKHSEPKYQAFERSVGLPISVLTHASDSVFLPQAPLERAMK